MYDRNIFRSSWKVFSNYQLSSSSSESFRKCSETVTRPYEIFGQLSVCLYNIKIVHGCLYIWNISSRAQLYILLAKCAHSWRIELNTRNIFQIYVLPHVILLFMFSLYMCSCHIYVMKNYPNLVTGIWYQYKLLQGLYIE